MALIIIAKKMSSLWFTLKSNSKNKGVVFMRSFRFFIWLRCSFFWGVVGLHWKSSRGLQWEFPILSVLPLTTVSRTSFLKGQWVLQGSSEFSVSQVLGSSLKAPLVLASCQSTRVPKPGTLGYVVKVESVPP